MLEIDNPLNTRSHVRRFFTRGEPTRTALGTLVCETTFTESRWLALFEAVNLIADKARERGIPWEEVELKPIAIEKYIESAANNIQRKILAQEHNIQIDYCDQADFIGNLESDTVLPLLPESEELDTEETELESCADLVEEEINNPHTPNPCCTDSPLQNQLQPLQ